MMRRGQAVLTAAVMAAIGLGAAGSAEAAATYATAQVNAGTTVNTSQSGTTTPSEAVMTRSIATGGATASGSAYAYSDIGVLRVGASVEAATPAVVRNAISSNAYANASWSDGLTLYGGATGTFGYFTANLLVDGSGGADITSYVPPVDQAQIALSLQLNGVGFAPVYANGGFTSSGGLDLPASVIELRIPIVFGYATLISMQAQAFAQASLFTDWGGSGVTADGAVDFSHTIRWGGITGVFTNDDQRIDDFTVASDSGFDFARAYPTAGGAVPEPATWGLMIAGFALTGAALRRRVAIA